MNKRKIAVVVILLLAVGLSVLGYVRSSSQSSATTANEPMQIVPVQRGTIAVTVSATGSIAPENQVVLIFKSIGRVKEILVEEGDEVEGSQVLAKLETSDLELQVAQAEAMLRASEAQLAQIKAGARPEDIAAAEAALDAAKAGVATAQGTLASAEANLAMLLAGPSETELRIAEAGVATAQGTLASAEANLAMLLAGPSETELQIAKQGWDQAKTSLWATQIERDGLAGNKATPRHAVDSANARVAAAETAANIARLQYEQAQAGPREEQVAMAQAQVDQAGGQVESAQAQVDARPREEQVAMAQAQVDQARGQVESAQAQADQAQAMLDKLKNGPTSEDLAVVEAQVDQSRVALEQARLQLEDAVIVAPFTGTVTALNVGVGELVSSARPVITLTDLSSFHIEVQVDESEIGRISMGQEVDITLDAFRDGVLTGYITFISPTATVQSGIVSYAVTVTLDPSDLALRVGMTADAAIITARTENVLVVPNRAIGIDRDSGKMYVEKLVDGQPVLVEIEAGASDELVSEVISGLAEGDRLVIRDISGRERFRQIWSFPGG